MVHVLLAIGANARRFVGWITGCALARMLPFRDAVLTADAGRTRGLVLIAPGLNRTAPQVIRHCGFATIVASTASETVTFARDLRPDVIVLAEQLSDMPGIDACRALRGDPFVAHGVPVLMLIPGAPSPEQRVAALRAGAWDFLRVSTNSSVVAMKLETYVIAKRNIDDALAADLVVPEARLYTSAGMAREARRLGALMRRMHGAFACVVFEWPDDRPDPSAGMLVARSARSSDIVGALTPRRVGVLAPATSMTGAVRLATRIGDRVRHLIEQLAADRGAAASGSRVIAGCDAVANVRYSPIDPVGLIARATAALRSGIPEPDALWVHSHEPDAALERSAAQ
jgi:CheY-like chemotaxis protein